MALSHSTSGRPNSKPTPEVQRLWNIKAPNIFGMISWSCLWPFARVFLAQWDGLWPFLFVAIWFHGTWLEDPPCSTFDDFPSWKAPFLAGFSPTMFAGELQSIPHTSAWYVLMSTESDRCSPYFPYVFHDFPHVFLGNSIPSHRMVPPSYKLVYKPH